MTCQRENLLASGIDWRPGQLWARNRVQAFEFRLCGVIMLSHHAMEGRARHRKQGVQATSEI